MSEAISTSKEIVVDPYSIPLDGNLGLFRTTPKRSPCTFL